MAAAAGGPAADDATVVDMFQRYVSAQVESAVAERTSTLEALVHDMQSKLATLQTPPPPPPPPPGRLVPALPVASMMAGGGRSSAYSGLRGTSTVDGSTTRRSSHIHASPPPAPPSLPPPPKPAVPTRTELAAAHAAAVHSAPTAGGFATAVDRSAFAGVYRARNVHRPVPIVSSLPARGASMRGAPRSSPSSAALKSKSPSRAAMVPAASSHDFWAGGLRDAAAPVVSPPHPARRAVSPPAPPPSASALSSATPPSRGRVPRVHTLRPRTSSAVAPVVDDGDDVVAIDAGNLDDAGDLLLETGRDAWARATARSSTVLTSRAPVDGAAGAVSTTANTTVPPVGSSVSAGGRTARLSMTAYTTAPPPSVEPTPRLPRAASPAHSVSRFLPFGSSHALSPAAPPPGMDSVRHLQPASLASVMHGHTARSQTAAPRRATSPSAVSLRGTSPRRAAAIVAAAAVGIPPALAAHALMHPVSIGGIYVREVRSGGGGGGGDGADAAGSGAASSRRRSSITYANIPASVSPATVFPPPEALAATAAAAAAAAPPTTDPGTVWRTPAVGAQGGSVAGSRRSVSPRLLARSGGTHGGGDSVSIGGRESVGSGRAVSPTAASSYSASIGHTLVRGGSMSGRAMQAWGASLRAYEPPQDTLAQAYALAVGEGSGTAISSPAAAALVRAASGRGWSPTLLPNNFAAATPGAAMQASVQSAARVVAAATGAATAGDAQPESPPSDSKPPAISPARARALLAHGAAHGSHLLAAAASTSAGASGGTPAATSGGTATHTSPERAPPVPAPAATTTPPSPSRSVRALVPLRARPGATPLAAVDELRPTDSSASLLATERAAAEVAHVSTAPASASAGRAGLRVAVEEVGEGGPTAGSIESPVQNSVGSGSASSGRVPHGRSVGGGSGSSWSTKEREDHASTAAAVRALAIDLIARTPLGSPPPRATGVPPPPSDGGSSWL